MPTVSAKKRNNSKRASGKKTARPRERTITDRRGKLIKPRHKRWFAAKCTIAITLLQGAMLLTWWVAPTWHPPRAHLLQLIWAWMHQPTFYPFVALLIGGPVLTILAVRIKGKHRLGLAICWGTFSLIAWFAFEDHLMAMVDVLRWKYDV